MPTTDLASPTRWLRSQSKSRQRRREAARRRRRRLHGSRGVGVVLAAMTFASGAAVAHERPAKVRAQASATVGVLERGDRGSAVRALQRKLGIGVDGVFGAQTARAVRRFQRRHDLTVDGVVGPATAAALGLSVSTRSTSRASRRLAGSSASPTLQRIAQCESGGNPRAVSAGGRYRGKYQFSLATWRAVGGTGDPAQASEREQDRRAAKLLAARGTSPWPNCA